MENTDAKKVITVGAYILRKNTPGENPLVIGKKVMDKGFGSEIVPLEPQEDSECCLLPHFND